MGRHDHYAAWRTLAVALASIAIGTGLAMITHDRRATPRPAPGTPAVTVMYGERGTFDHDAGGFPMACTDELIVGDSWRCQEWSVDTTNAVIVEPKAYVGQCTHVRADQELGRWVCLGGPPAAPTPRGNA